MKVGVNGKRERTSTGGVKDKSIRRSHTTPCFENFCWHAALELASLYATTFS